MELGRRATGLRDDGLAVIARLLVSPSSRRQGVGRALLQTAARRAGDLGLCPILDVAVTYQAANHLYEAEGWRRLGAVRFPMPDGHAVDEYVYLGPTQARGPAGPGSARKTVT
jgi:GNAT superfamily N-acetyltransferase